MSRDTIGRYVWIIDTLRRYGHLTRSQLNSLWVRSPLSGGRPMPERTFHNYRRGIEQSFNITIECNSAGEYSVAEDDDARRRTISDWMLDSYAVSDALLDSATLAERVEVEDVPSAREFLPIAMEAVRDNLTVVFTYAGFNRSRPEEDIAFHPYFLKRYKQRWYMVGVKEKSGELRTYALDRVRQMVLTDTRFERPEDFTPEDVFGNIIGVTTSRAEVRDVKLMATPTQAKYFRALPLHPTQREELHDHYSIFTYRLKLNYELVSEILALGDAVKVIAPTELKVMVATSLRSALSQYLD
ncbi:MAG: WYL domain-containing protein [Muribaculaceae bacterium]|nr:WYL domain-containing protein [Muribaculaceae bacterium]